MADAGPPPVDRQRAYIVSNADHLDLGTLQTIRNRVMSEVGAAPFLRGTRPDESNLDLDELGPDLVLFIYNLVRARVRALDQPAC